MNIYPFVFSINPRYRITRHVLFWVVWISYYSTFTVLSWGDNDHTLLQKISAAVFEITVSTPMDLIYCYSIIYFLLPKFLYRGKYLTMVFLWIVFSFLFLFAFYGYATYILPHIRNFTGMPPAQPFKSFTWYFFNLFSQINMEGALAACIKLGKMWFIKQQELDLINSEKQKIVPKIAEGLVQPVFLISALDKIEMLAIEKPSVIPNVIKKIKKFLVYVIYDSNQARVSIETEMSLLEEYIELEKIATKDNLNVNLKIFITKKNAAIAPSILLPLIENCFKQLSSYDLQSKDIDIEFKLVEEFPYAGIF